MGEAMTYSIYKITNAINGKFYIGFTTKPLCVRLNEHKSRSRTNSRFRLYQAMAKYGIENFSIETLKEGDDAEWGLKVEEPYFIGMYRPEYNMTPGGNGSGPLGLETKRKISVSMSGEKNPAYGKPGTFLGHTHKESTRVLIREARKTQIIPKDKKYGREGSWNGVNSSKIKCPRCQIVTTPGNAKRWHFENCVPERIPWNKRFKTKGRYKQRKDKGLKRNYMKPYSGGDHNGRAKVS